VNLAWLWSTTWSSWISSISLIRLESLKMLPMLLMLLSFDLDDMVALEQQCMVHQIRERDVTGTHLVDACRVSICP